MSGLATEQTEWLHNSIFSVDVFFVKITFQVGPSYICPKEGQSKQYNMEILKCQVFLLILYARFKKKKASFIQSLLTNLPSIYLNRLAPCVMYPNDDSFLVEPRGH